MATRRVEGYETDDAAMQGKAGDEDAWLDGLRDEAQRALVRKLALERIQKGEWEGDPDPHGLESSSSRLTRLIEGVLIGVSVTLLSGWVCSILRGDDKRSR